MFGRGAWCTAPTFSVEGHHYALVVIGGPRPGDHLEVVEGPWLENQVGTLHVDGRHAEVRLEKTLPADGEDRRLERVFTRTISG